jgi:hypothetical protein
VFSPLQAYFLPTHGNGEVPVLGKLPYYSCPLYNMNAIPIGDNYRNLYAKIVVKVCVRIP